MKKTNKLLKNIFAGLAVFSLLSGFMYADDEVFLEVENQNEDSDNNSQTKENGIELPDLTTIISGTDTIFNSEAIPDFSNVILVDNLQSNIQLEMPDVVFEETNSSVFLPSVQSDKGIYAEGKIGGGYPGSFIGEFSIMQDKGVSPFEIFYSHSSFDGYNGMPLYSGYNDNETIIKINRTLNFNKQNLTFGGFYETLGNGLQSKVVNVSAINQRDMNAVVKYDYNIIDKLVAGVDFTGDYYNRFANLSIGKPEMTAEEDAALWFKNYSYCNLNPELYLAWNNTMFDTKLSASYIFNNDFSADNYINRGEVSGQVQWKNAFLDVSADIDLVFGNKVQQSVLVPFSLGVTYSFPVYFSDRKLSLTGNGGLLSYQNSVFDLEKKYKFAALNELPGESSDWYGKFNISVPLKSSVTINADMEYKHTAFGNGIYEPIYDKSGFSNGIYQISQKTRHNLNSQLEFVYHYKLFALSAGWYANWFDVPALENKQTFVLSLALQNEQSLWGVSLSGLYNMDADGLNLVPCLDFEAFVRLNNAVRLVLTVNDGIKLVTGQKRIYVGEDNREYIAQSGSANLLVKFFF